MEISPILVGSYREERKKKSISRSPDWRGANCGYSSMLGIKARQLIDHFGLNA